MAAAQQIFEVVAPPAGSNLTVEWYIRLHGKNTPDWVRRAGKPFAGKIPDGSPVLDVDPDAEQREAAEREAQLRKEREADPRLTNAETMGYLNWSEADYIEARDGYGFPKCDAYRIASGNLLGTGGEPTRRKSEIDKWVQTSREKIARLSRLVGGVKR